MILRRLTKHVKDQNWFAVGLDFFIVVFGVFIGLQVSNWNDARSLIQKEKAYLTELRQEVSDNMAVQKNSVNLMNIVLSSGENALEFLEGNAPCESNCWSLLVDFFFASQIMATPTPNTVLDEMEKLGLPKSQSIRSALKLYSSNGGATAFVSSELPLYREHIRGLFSVKAHRALWASCHTIYPQETFITDCKAGISEAETRALLEKFQNRPDLIEQLSYWIGQNIFNQPTLAQQIQHGEKVITAIDQELGHTP